MLKRILKYSGLLALLALAGFFALILAERNDKKINLEPRCVDIKDSEISSRRSLGLIIQDRKMLALRLDSEGNYSAPGGHIDFGESPEGALSRELKEELGIETTSQDLEFFKVDCESNKKEREKMLFYLVKGWQGQISLGGVGDKAKWVNFSYEAEKKADVDLKLALYYLKEADLID